MYYKISREDLRILINDAYFHCGGNMYPNDYVEEFLNNRKILKPETIIANPQNEKNNRIKINIEIEEN